MMHSKYTWNNIRFLSGTATCMYLGGRLWYAPVPQHPLMVGAEIGCPWRQLHNSLKAYLLTSQGLVWKHNEVAQFVHVSNPISSCRGGARLHSCMLLHSQECQQVCLGGPLAPFPTPHQASILPWLPYTARRAISPVSNPHHHALITIHSQEGH